MNPKGKPTKFSRQGLFSRLPPNITDHQGCNREDVGVRCSKHKNKNGRHRSGHRDSERDRHRNRERNRHRDRE